MYYFVFLFCLTKALASTTPEQFEANVDAVIQKALLCHPHNPGLTISVVKGNKTLLAKGYGVRNLASQEPVTNQTLFQIASMTKAFTSTLLVKQLHESSNLSIYSTIRKIFGDSFSFLSYQRTHYANLRDLLSHTLGIPNNNYMRFDSTLTRQGLPSRMKTLHSTKTFRQSYTYSNLNYGLLTYISEKLGNKKWEDLVQEQIFKPLGMVSSGFMTRADSSMGLAQAYVDDFNTNQLFAVPLDLSRKWSLLCGSTCILSNAVDMTKWMKFHLNGGRDERGKEVVDKNTLASTYMPRNAISSSTVGKYFTKPQVPVTNSENTYALGWKNGFYRDYRILRHSGSTWGYTSYITLFPEMDIGIFTSMTGPDKDYIFRILLHSYLADMALGLTPWLNSTTICTFPQPWYDSISFPKHTPIVKTHPRSRPVSEYIGTYSNDAYGNISVQYNRISDTLTLTLGYATWNLYPRTQHDQFRGEGTGLIKNIKNLSYIKFISRPDGNSDIGEIEMTSFETSSPPTFTRIDKTEGYIPSPVG